MAKAYLGHSDTTTFQPLAKEQAKAHVEAIKTFYTPEKPIEIIKEVPVEIEKIVEVIKEVPVEVTKYVDREVEKLVEVIKEVPVEVLKFVDKPIEVIKQEFVEIEKEIFKVPNWTKAVMAIQLLMIVGLVIKLAL